MVDACALEQLGHALHLPEQKVRDCLDPVSNVQGRSSAGGPSLGSLMPSLARASERLSAERTANQQRRARMSEADLNLQALTRAQAGL